MANKRAKKHAKKHAKTRTTHKHDKTAERVKVPECDIVRPEGDDVQQLAAMIFAEAEPSREQDDEREAIAWVMLNRREHNTKHPRDGMGGTTIWSIVSASDVVLAKGVSTIRKQFDGYGNLNWNLVMSGQNLKPQIALKNLTQTESKRLLSGKITTCESFKRCIAVATRVLQPDAQPSDPTYLTFIAYQLGDPRVPAFRMDLRDERHRRLDNDTPTRVGNHYFITWVDGREDPNPKNWPINVLAPDPGQEIV